MERAVSRGMLLPGLTGRARLIAVLLVLAAGVAMVYAFEPTTAGFYPQCVFYKATGRYCPGCGTARGLHALFHLDVAGALPYNPLMVVSLPLLLYAGLKNAYRNISGTDTPRRILPAWVIWCIFVLIVSYWLLRNVPYYPFTLLAPG